MPIDEFGREVPAGVGGSSGGVGGGASSSVFADPLRRGDHEKISIGDEAASAVKSNNNGDDKFERRRGRSRSFDRNDSSGGGGEDHHHRRGGRKRSRSHSVGDHDENHHRSPRNYHHHHHHRGHHHDHRRSGGGGRRHRSRSYGHDDDSHHHHRHHKYGRDGGSSRGEKANPSITYAAEPLLCQFIWKKELEDKARKERLQEEKAKKKENGDVDMTNENNKEASNDDTAKENNSDEGNVDGDADIVGGNNAGDATPDLPPLFESEEAENEAYEEYNAKYCLSHVRTFFNHHLDDPWFRRRLSPLEAYRQAKKERTRANEEASEMKKEILQSLEDMQSGVIPKKDPDCPDYLGPPKCNFVGSCRLGVGTKPTSAMPYRRDNYNNNYDNVDASTSTQHLVLQGEDRNRIERHAKSHLHSFVKSDACVKIMDVPSHVSDEQLLASLAGHCTIKPPTAVWSSDVFVPTVSSSRSRGESRIPYHREAYAVFPSTTTKDNMLDNLQKANEDANRHHRREDRHKDRRPRFLDLDVDCTDIYGRRELDADGKGTAPPKKKGEADTQLPQKRCTVFVSTAIISSSQPVSVLSAAVSSRDRISGDKEDAKTIARALDEVREINSGNRLSDLMLLLFPGEELSSVDEEDILDIAIAYLRRVHLFSFYNGCTVATDVGNVLSYSHPCGTIHLRLRDSDEILRKTAEENGDVAMDEAGGGDHVSEKADDVEGAGAGKDMLVTRLNDSIAKALENVSLMEERGPTCVIDEDTDMAAKDIQTSEQNTREQWMQNHEITDEDGRARCSFHFCRKLFKDKAFLQKHLQKKHSDQLRAECGKCHDGVMMASWDNDEKRPVPPILIDCGSKFGFVPSAVVGSGRPITTDPEPELWKEEQERIAEEEKRYQERQAAAEAAAKSREEEQQRRKENSFSRGNFVDVDDMVEEKVELSFENIDVAHQVKPKKKKRKKSLL